MKTIYMFDLDYTIKTATADLAASRKALVPVKKELRTWQPGRPEHDAATALQAELNKQIADFKKQIADAQRLKKNPEVLRRHEICEAVERLAKYGMALVRADSVSCYVNDAPGGKVEAATENTKNWNYYAKSFTFPKIEHDVVITVNPDWDKVVQDRDLEFLGGMLTLSAKPAHKGRNRKALDLAAQYDIVLFEATWMRKGRGFQVTTESGFIAVKYTSLGVIPSTAYHSESAMAAVEGSHRKFQNIDSLPMEVRDVPADAVATWADVAGVGACRAGVINWCNLVGIDHTAESVSLLDVVRGYYKNPAPEAKAIILRVLRSCPRKAA
ncbi:hypothetical protein [Acidithiobacillus thiooxidans]|uniref:Uncharacterized protein n=1 Tax=Acidithiobacillus thiooxidans TaxID=930 RepID=A0A1C2IHT8_ACITH|nr:hypothetical protein [Acidithiobacillus thiooxidans]OCX75540.1 hypothetical protein A6M23_01985 [Acidithiobacillus thiooxidans]OCX78191.1 hypothetical protein A6P08_19950 [Acidithiobacillus thiooxidans]